MNYIPATVSIYTYVRNRLPFLADTPNNQALVGSFIYESMVELDTCFQVDSGNTAYNKADPTTWYLGDETKYTELEKLIVADLTACAIIGMRMASNSEGTASGTTDGKTTSGKYLSRSKAGSVEAEWKGFDVSDQAGFYTTGQGLYNVYREAALRRALNMGCLIDVTTEMGLKLYEIYKPLPVPFVVVQDGCGCRERMPVDRGGFTYLSYPL